MAGIAALLTLGIAAGCEPSTRAPLAPAEAGGFCLAFTAGRSSVGLGEPVIVAVSLRNCSKEAKLVKDLLAPEYGLLRLSVVPPVGGRPLPWRPAVARDGRGKHPRRLVPGQSLVAWVRLFADANGWTLGRPGRYEVRAEYAAQEVPLSAAPLTLTVTEGATAEDRAAAELVMERAAAMLLLTGRDEGERGSKGLVAVLQQHPRSFLAAYAQLALGLERTQETLDPTLKIFRKADCAGAVDLLTPALRQVPDPFWAALGTRSLAQCLRALGRPADAEAAIQGYSRSHPGGPELPGVVDVLR